MTGLSSKSVPRLKSSAVRFSVTSSLEHRAQWEICLAWDRNILTHCYLSPQHKLTKVLFALTLGSLTTSLAVQASLQQQTHND